MKILHTITTMDPRLGGVCQAVRTMATSLNQLGVINEVVCLDAADAEFLKNDPTTIHALGPAKGPWIYSAALYPWLENNITRFDIVIIHGLWQYQSHAAAKAFRAARKSIKAKGFVPQLLVMPHGMLDPYFQRASGRKLKAIRNYFYWKLIENTVVNCADGLLFTCEQERVLAHEPFAPYNPKRELVVGLGVDQPPPATASVREALTQLNESGKSFLLFLSRINEKKGVDLLLESYQQLSTGKGSKHDLIVAGPGLDTPYGNQLKSLANRDEQVARSISFPGMLSGDRKWAAIYGCSAFVLPSHQENFGIAVVEALACGKPVLISDQVNIWREIADAGCGLVAADTLSGTSELLEKWERLTDDEKSTMGIRARALYESNFEVRQAALRLFDALKTVHLSSAER